jgi:L-amino acid N-acyltransferase YncA
MENYRENGNIMKCGPEDFNTIYEIINDAAIAYKGVIPYDMWHEPYMTKDQLKSQIDQGVDFWSYNEQNRILGVMGIQPKGKVTLIRHAYVRTEERKKGIGSKLLKNLCVMSTTPI